MVLLQGLHGLLFLINQQMEETTKGEIPFKSKTGATKNHDLKTCLNKTLEVSSIDFVSRLLNPRVAQSEFGCCGSVWKVPNASSLSTTSAMLNCSTNSGTKMDPTDTVTELPSFWKCCLLSALELFSI